MVRTNLTTMTYDVTAVKRSGKTRQNSLSVENKTNFTRKKDNRHIKMDKLLKVSMYVENQSISLRKTSLSFK